MINFPVRQKQFEFTTHELRTFEIKGRNYLIAVDYYSNFIEVDYLPTMTSSQMIGILKKHFARYGIPSIVMSDNGLVSEYSVALITLRTDRAHP
jgi:hypothetical protein